MIRKLIPLVALALVASASAAFAQSTGLPQYYAPYRAFESYEIGGTLSFPKGDATGIEGSFGFGYKAFDIGLRGGVVTNGSTEFVIGADGRIRVVTQSESFPLDGAVTFGVGTWEFDNLIAPVGISLGRRIDIKDSPVAVTPYAQPVLFFVFDDSDQNTANIAVGFGADFELSDVFVVRGSFGVGGSRGIGEGFAISAVWVH